MGQNQSQTAIWVVLALIIATLVAGAFWIADKTNLTNPLNEDIAQIESLVQVAPTVEEAIQLHTEAVNDDYLYGIYLELPDYLLKEIYTRIGTLATPDVVATEYLSNREYYISLQVTDAMKDIRISGPDADRIQKIGVKTILKDEPKGSALNEIVPEDTLK